ncbi:TPA: restriction endonuclease subunit S [Klebsiella quasipneumoniae subsp. quasipneumoniae]|uniref:Restriction endonuclease subunit S n=5 Tax=Klebsiella pneumoniae complex TaxID=3390273 RepID=A0A7L7TD87_9ENTR|nr:MULTISPECIES: restriction endonuclease subunit S [Klebsiella]HBS3705185.1 restriction endonuclease subunit S [Klebsiella quasipneumoniae subsp. quasipneumoniae]HDT4435362.1 restriction endonuclease subunit S [Klebsiella pneumoniae subsp. ozaenae]AVT91646.1 restriction endonuclease subunit S [Klebsiella pneumoniae]EIV5818368.1 restriction endonuclease subunit S [Klebsiella pneumoniae]EIY2223844.1 restriction endonuclease subunit S [Klebsiella pneumoniae]
MSALSYLEKLLNGVDVEWVALGSIADIGTGSSNRQDESDNGTYPFFVRSKNILKSDTFEFDEVAIVIPGEGGVGDIFHYVEGKYALHQRAYRISIQSNSLITKFVYHFMLSSFKQYILMKSVGATAISIRKPMLEGFQVPIPCPDQPEKSLAIQSEIVRILDKFTALTAELTAELTMRKKQYNYYRDQLLSLEEDEIEWKALDDVCAFISAGGDVPENSVKGQVKPTNEYPYPIYANATDEKGLYGYTDSYKIDSDAVTISARGAKVGYHTVRDAKFTPIIRLIVLVANKNLVRTRYLNYVLDMTAIGGTDGGIPQLTVPMVKKITVPIPFASNPNRSLAEQDRIIAILDKFEILTNSISEGLPREINLRQKQYEYYRDLLLSFPKSNV